MTRGVIGGAVAGALSAALVLAGSAFAGSGIGAVFNLGRANTVNQTSTLSGSVAGGPTLDGRNAGGGPAASFFAKAGRPPFRVSSGGMVTNLNADLLDGIQA